MVRNIAHFRNRRFKKNREVTRMTFNYFNIQHGAYHSGLYQAYGVVFDAASTVVGLEADLVQSVSDQRVVPCRVPKQAGPLAGPTNLYHPQLHCSTRNLFHLGQLSKSRIRKNTVRSARRWSIDPPRAIHLLTATL